MRGVYCKFHIQQIKGDIMNKVNLINSNLHNSNKGLLICKNCGRSICNIGDNLNCYKISFICSCGSMGSAELNTPKHDFSNTSSAILKNNHIICPCCNSQLMALSHENFINIAFRIKCNCGCTFDKFTEYTDLNKRLSEYNI